MRLQSWRNDVLLDLNADWSAATTYLNGPGVDNHLRQTSASTGVSYYLTDHLGSTAALADATGNIVEQVAYDSFGNSTGSALTRYDYTGRERDPDTGLMYYRARWYDAQVGRFISEDPIGFQGEDVNLNAYVENDPLNSNDPSGLKRGRGPGHRVSLRKDPPPGQKAEGCFMAVDNYSDGSIANYYLSNCIVRLGSA